MNKIKHYLELLLLALGYASAFMIIIVISKFGGIIGNLLLLFAFCYFLASSTVSISFHEHELYHKDK